MTRNQRYAEHMARLVAGEFAQDVSLLVAYGSFVTGGSSAGTVVITAVLLLIFALIAVKIVKDRKKNRCCGCKDCPVGGCCGKSDCGEGNAENQADKDKED